MFVKSVAAALTGIALVLSVGASSVSAQDRSNKGGELRGEDRAGQVQEMNKGAKEARDTDKAAKQAVKKDKKPKKEKKAKKAKKPQKQKSGE